MREALQISEPAQLHVVLAVSCTHRPSFSLLCFCVLCCRRNGRLASVALREADP